MLADTFGCVRTGRDGGNSLVISGVPTVSTTLLDRLQ